jgi:DNA recombination protein RmuC
VLGHVKKEFSKFGEVIDKVKRKLHEATNHIDSVDTRTRAINRKLRSVEEQAGETQPSLLPLETEGDEEVKE